MWLGMTIPPINPWLSLVIAGLLEVAWASGFKFVGVQRPVTSLVVGVTMVASFWISLSTIWRSTARADVRPASSMRTSYFSPTNGMPLTTSMM